MIVINYNPVSLVGGNGFEAFNYEAYTLDLTTADIIFPKDYAKSKFLVNPGLCYSFEGQTDKVAIPNSHKGQELPRIHWKLS